MREKKILHRLNTAERLLVCFSVFNGISKLFLGTFVVSFLMHNSINEIISVSVYNLFFYFTIMLTFMLMIDRCKRGNIKLVFGSHIIVQIALVVLIAILGNHAVNWVMLLGALYGAQHALYSMSQQRMVIDKVSASRMMFFYGTDVATVNLVKILVPIILGTLITIGTLQNIAWIIAIMGVVEFVLLFKMPSINYHEKQKADLIGFLRQSIKFPCVRKLFVAELFRGLAFVLETLGVMYIVYVFHSEMNLGIWTTVFGICTTLASWLFGRFCSKRDFYWVIMLVSVLLIGSIISLIIDVNVLSTIAYAGTLALGIEIMDQICSVNILNFAKTKFITKKYRAEYIAARQIFSFLGRWGGILLLLYIGVFSGYNVLPYLIVVLASIRIYATILFIRVGKYIK